MFDLKEVNHKLCQQSIIRDINLSSKTGELIAIIGPNGAGKSTLIKCLAGTITPSGGTVYYHGKDINSYSTVDLAKMRAYLSQHVSMAFDFNVSDVVLMGRYPYSRDRITPQDKEIVHEVMERTGVLHLENRFVHTLSGGELQRVHFARALAQVHHRGYNSRKLLLLDEPVNNLDPRYQHDILVMSREEAVQNSTVVVTVLHDLNLAARYADRVVLMKQGTIIAQGEPEKVMMPEYLEPLYDLPVTVFHSGAAMHIACGAGCEVLKNKEIMNHNGSSPVHTADIAQEGEEISL
jgi:iron complex transport system ATP-binding protein